MRDGSGFLPLFSLRAQALDNLLQAGARPRPQHRLELGERFRMASRHLQERGRQVVTRVREGGVQLQGLPVLGNGIGQAAGKLRERVPEVVVRGGGIRANP